MSTIAAADSDSEETPVLNRVREYRDIGCGVEATRIGCSCRSNTLSAEASDDAAGHRIGRDLVAEDIESE